MLTTVYVYDFGEETPRLLLKGDTLYDALSSEYADYPKGAYLYRGKDFVEENRLSFLSEQEKKGAVDYKGEFSLVFCPQDPVTIIAAVGGLLLSIAMQVLFKPKVPNNLTQNQNASSNNTLAERENQQRLGGLVPEIYGTVLATPDLIAVPYTIYNGSQEVEYAVMCLGRGRYEIDTSQIYDDTTPLKRIAGALVDVYDANQSVNNPLDASKYSTSDNKFDDVVWNTKKCNAVNGQTLLPPNSGTVNGETRLYYQAVGTTYTINSQTVEGLTIDFTEHFVSGDTVTIASQGAVKLNRFIVTSAQSAITFTKTSTPTYKITESLSWLSWANVLTAGDTVVVTGTASGTYDGTYTVSSISGSDLFISAGSTTNPSSWPTTTSAYQNCQIQYTAQSFNFNGTYTVLSADKYALSLTLTTPQKAVWDGLKLLSSDGTSLGNTQNTAYDGGYLAVNSQAMQIQVSKTRWSQTFVIEGDNINNLICNFSCPNGLYATTDQQYSNTVGVQMSVFPCDINGAILGGYSEQLEDLTLNGSSQSTSPVYATMRCNIYQSWWKTLNGTVTFQKSGSNGIITRVGSSFSFTDYLKSGITDLTIENAGAPYDGTGYTITSISASSVTVTGGNVSSWSTTASATKTPHFFRALTSNMIAGRRAILAVWGENIDASTPLWITRIRYNDSGDSTHRGDQVIIATYDGSTYGTWGRSVNSAGAVAAMYPYKQERPVWVTVYKETATNSGTIDTNTNQKIHLLIDYRLFASLGSSQIVELSSTANPPNDYLAFSNNVFSGGGFPRIGVKVRRSTDKNYDGGGQFVDETKIKDIYSQGAFTGEDFGNVTTIYSKTLGTEGALSLKKRKLNIQATRALRCYNKDGDYINADGTKYPDSSSPYNPPYLATNRLDHIFVNVLRDPLIGNIPLSQIDTTSLYAMSKLISQYFGEGDTYTTGSGYPLLTTQSSFNYTFDKADMSLYDMVRSIGAANDITVYGELNQFKFLFEYANMPASLLFNHRNKIPKTQTRTINFGSRENYDGIELDWINPSKYDAHETLKIPYTGTALNPMKVETVGIRNERQAFITAWRAYFKMRYQTVMEEFEALPEALLLAKGMRFYSADNTRSGIYDGEIVSRSGFILELSQPVDLSTLTNPYIYIQHKDGTIQALPVSQGVDLYHVVYSGTLTNSLIVDASYYAQNTYQIWGDEDWREKSFLLEERSPNEGGTHQVKGMLFDPLFYTADQMTFWFQPLDQNCIDRTFNHRDPLSVNGASIRLDSASVAANNRGYCFYNSNSNGYMKFPSSNPLSLADEFTLSAWIKFDSTLTIPTGQDFQIFNSTNGTSLRFCVSKGSSTYSLKGIRGTSSDVVTSTQLTNPTSWNFVTLTHQLITSTQARINLYLNGVQMDTALITPVANNQIYMGGDGASGGFLGWIDGAMVFYDNMSSIEVRSLYLATLGLTATTKF